MLFLSFKGARSPLAREPDAAHLKEDSTETNFSNDFSDILE